MANPENLIKHQMKKGTTLNPNGRPPKISTILKREGLSESQVRDIAQEMLAMTIDELKEIATNPKSKAYEVMLATAFKNAMQKGDLSQVFGQVLHRLFGQPKQEIETNITGIECIITGISKKS